MNFQIGDRVRFKSLDEIHRLDKEEKIPHGWNEDMNSLCGMEYTIENITNGIVSFEEKDAKVQFWTIDTIMLELAEDPGRAVAIEELIANDHILDLVMS